MRRGGELAAHTDDPHQVAGCADCLELVSEDLNDNYSYGGHCLHCKEPITAVGSVAWRRAVRRTCPHCGNQGWQQMILKTIERFRSLSGYHWKTIIVTILLPVILPTVFSLHSLEFSLPVRVLLIIGVFFVWAVIAIYTVASMLLHDKTEANHVVNQEVCELQTRIEAVEGRQLNSPAILRAELDNLEETIRSTLKNDLGADLPHRPVLGWPSAVRWNIEVSSPTVTLVGGTWGRRLQLRLRRTLSQAWRIVYGATEDNENPRQ